VIYGYDGVSTDGQSVDARAKALRCAAGAEKVSRRRPAARRPTAPGRAVLDALGQERPVAGDRLGRLARATRDLLDTLDAIAGAGAGFRPLADAWPDTTTRTAD